MSKESAHKTTPEEAKKLMEKILHCLSDLQYGEIVIKVQGGKVIWVDKHERERLG